MYLPVNEQYQDYGVMHDAFYVPLLIKVITTFLCFFTNPASRLYQDPTQSTVFMPLDSS